MKQDKKDGEIIKHAKEKEPTVLESSGSLLPGEKEASQDIKLPLRPILLLDYKPKTS